jgi:hypothetical protein
MEPLSDESCATGCSSAGTNVLSALQQSAVQTASDYQKAKTAPAGSYFIDFGTSMAAPLVAGCGFSSGLLRARFGQLGREYLSSN